jgi:hypothetical protein
MAEGLSPSGNILQVKFPAVVTLISNSFPSRTVMAPDLLYYFYSSTTTLLLYSYYSSALLY